MLELIERLMNRPSGGVSDEVVYAEHCAEFRALNTLFWQIPVLVTTLTGGLWFALASLDLTDAGQRMILWFSAVVNVAFFVALIRLRVIMEGLLVQIRRFEGRRKQPLSYVVLTTFGALMAITTIGALVVAAHPDQFLESRHGSGTVVLCSEPPGQPITCRALTP